MVYEPNSYDPEKAVRTQRERLYWMTLLTGLGNAAVLVLHLNGIETILLGWLVGGMVGALIVAGIRGHTDDYYNQLINAGMRLMAFGLGVLLLLLWMHAETSLIARLIPGFAVLAQDAFLLALVLSLLFHAGYAFAYLRDLLASGTSE
jgi:hypothetical protein